MTNKCTEFEHNLKMNDYMQVNNETNNSINLSISKHTRSIRIHS